MFIHPGLFREISSRLPALRKFGMQEILELMFGIMADDPDPEAGDQQTTVISFTYGDPDPSVFALPAGYTVQAAHR